MAAVVTSGAADIDAGSVRVVQAAFDDLISRGYARGEVENVFRRFRRRLKADGSEKTGPSLPCGSMERDRY